MTTPSSVPPVPSPRPEPVTPEVIATATRVVRVKKVLKSSFRTLGTTVVAGTVGGLVAVGITRRSKDSDEDVDTVDDSTE